MRKGGRGTSHRGTAKLRLPTEGAGGGPAAKGVAQGAWGARLQKKRKGRGTPPARSFAADAPPPGEWSRRNATKSERCGQHRPASPESSVGTDAVRPFHGPGYFPPGTPRSPTMAGARFSSFGGDGPPRARTDIPIRRGAGPLRPAEENPARPGRPPKGGGRRCGDIRPRGPGLRPGPLPLLFLDKWPYGATVFFFCLGVASHRRAGRCSRSGRRRPRRPPSAAQLRQGAPGSAAWPGARQPSLWTIAKRLAPRARRTRSSSTNLAITLGASSRGPARRRGPASSASLAATDTKGTPASLVATWPAFCARQGKRDAAEAAGPPRPGISTRPGGGDTPPGAPPPWTTAGGLRDEWAPTGRLAGHALFFSCFAAGQKNLGPMGIGAAPGRRRLGRSLRRGQARGWARPAFGRAAGGGGGGSTVRRRRPPSAAEAMAGEWPCTGAAADGRWAGTLPVCR